MTYIPYGRQNISEKDVAAVVEVLQSDYLTQGPMVAQFELVLAQYCQASFATAFSNATAALHCACLALGVGPGDLVWTSPNTFVASANCVLYCGANIDFVDIDLNTYNMSVEKLEEKLISARSKNRLPKVVIPVHFSGNNCDMISIKKLSEEYGFKIIEDASHSIGARYCDRPVGNCQYSDICIFSFHPVKIITTGEGGAAMTNDFKLKSSLDLYRSHGITRDEGLMPGGSHGSWYYQQIALGYNYRITDLQCALGLSQMNRLDAFVTERHECVSNYFELLNELPLNLPSENKNCYSAYHLYVVTLDQSRCSLSRKKVFDYLREASIGVNVHYIPVHTQPYYEKLGFTGSDFPNAVSYYERAITLPLYPGLILEQQEFIRNKLAEILS